MPVTIIAYTDRSPMRRDATVVHHPRSNAAPTGARLPQHLREDPRVPPTVVTGTNARGATVPQSGTRSPAR